MSHIILKPELKRLIKEKQNDILIEFFSDYHPKQAAEFLDTLRPGNIWYVLSILDENTMGSIFSYFDIERQQELLSYGNEGIIRRLLDNLSSDDRADLFKTLDDSTYKEYLSLLPHEDKKDVENLTAYDEGTAGASMSTDFAFCYLHQTVKDLFDCLRAEGASKETIYYIYVIDDEGLLKGMVSLKDAVLAETTEKIEDIMSADIISGNTDDDQEEIARQIEEYDLIALPITDSEGKLAGIVTYDDVMDIIQEEQTEDVERMMAISGDVEERDYLDVPVFVHFKKRVPWVVALFVLGNLSALVVGHFEHILDRVVILAFFFPLLMGTGGNTGSQAASVVLRSLTLKELADSDFIKVIFKEFLISLILSIVLLFFMYIRVYFTYNSNDFAPWQTALAISLALGAQVISSTLIGAILPLLASRLKLDPAVVAMPAITTIVDITGLIIYFLIAQTILGL